jgi:hypothetical protein
VQPQGNFSLRFFALLLCCDSEPNARAIARLQG